jgi:Major Facilitator Superfamily
MAVASVSLFGGAFFTPIMVGKIAHSIGWQWSFYLVAIVAGICFPLVLFLVPEMDFPRSDMLFEGLKLDEGCPDEHRKWDKPALEYREGKTRRQEVGEHVCQCGVAHNPSTHGEGFLDNNSLDDIEAKQQGINSKAAKKAEKLRLQGKSEEDIAIIINPPKEPKVAWYPRENWAQRLLPFNGRHTDDNILKLVITPFPLIFQPAVIWAMLIQGTMIGWTVLIGVVLAAVFYGPPLWLTEAETGYLYVGPCLGALAGYVITGYHSDYFTQRIMVRNKFRYEPEFRIFLVLPQLIFGCAGLFGFGLTASNIPKYGKIVPDVFFALEVCGMVSGTIASALYIVDAYRKSCRYYS